MDFERAGSMAGIDEDGSVKQEPGKCFIVAWPLRVERDQLCTAQFLHSVLLRTLEDTWKNTTQTLQLNTRKWYRAKWWWRPSCQIALAETASLI